MVEFDIDGQKFTLAHALTTDDIRGIVNAYDNVRTINDQTRETQSKENALTLEQFYYQFELVYATLQKCFSMSREEIDKLGYHTVVKLYQKLFEYCAKAR